MGKKILLFMVFMLLTVSAFGEMLYIAEQEDGDLVIIDEKLESHNISPKNIFYDFNRTEPPLDNDGIILTGKISGGELEFSFIDKTGKNIIPNFGINDKFGFQSVKGFSEGFAAIEINNKWGYINKEGKIAITPQFEDACEFRDGMAPVKVNGKWGYINTKGEIVIKPEYDLSAIYELLFFCEGLARVELNGKIGYINTKGEIVIKPQFNGGSYFSEGLAEVQIEGLPRTLDSKWGYIDKTGKILIKQAMGNFHNGLARVEIGNKWGYMDKTGKIVVKPLFDEVGDFNEGLAPVAKYFITDEKNKGKENISRYDSGVNRLCGYIDTKGELVIDYKYQEAYPFINAIAVVTDQNQKNGFIDKNGNYLIEPKYEEIKFRFKNKIIKAWR